MSLIPIDFFFFFFFCGGELWGWGWNCGGDFTENVGSSVFFSSMGLVRCFSVRCQFIRLDVIINLSGFTVIQPEEQDRTTRLLVHIQLLFQAIAATAFNPKKC